MLNAIISRWNYVRNHFGFSESPAAVLLRLMEWRFRCWLRVPATIRLSRRSIDLFLPPKWRGVASHIFAFREYYETELYYLSHFFSPGMVFVDVGANIGIYTAIASRIAGDSGRVFAFEPGSEAYKILKYNIESNHLANVKTFCLALSNQDGRVPLYHHPDIGRFSLGCTSASDNKFEYITTTTLDKLINRNAIDRMDFLKIDTEGAEELVLLGAESSLTRYKPIVMFEVQDERVTKENVNSLGLYRDGAWDLLAKCGYQFFLVTYEGNLRRIGSIPTWTCNVIAVHNQSESVLLSFAKRTL